MIIKNARIHNEIRNLVICDGKIAEITAFAKRVGRTRSELMVDATLEYVRSNA